MISVSSGFRNDGDATVLDGYQSDELHRPQLREHMGDQLMHAAFRHRIRSLSFR